MLGSIGSRDRRPFSPPHYWKTGQRLWQSTASKMPGISVLDSSGARENKIVLVACVHPSFRE